MPGLQEDRAMRILSKRNGRQKSRSHVSNRAQLRVEQLESRLVLYSVSGNVWPHPQLVTLSFVPDGTNLGGVTSNLFATFNAKWATNVWQNQILRAAQVWAQQANLNFAVVSDNGTQIGGGSYQQGDPNMGDIRIGGYNFQSTTLASAYLPPPVNNYSIAGDWQFNTGQPFNIGSTYDLFTVAAHEMGHALGLLHSTTAQAIMYASYNTRKTALNSDDISGIQAIYGTLPADGTNTGFSTATDITSQVDPTSLTGVVNNLGLVSTSDNDYFKVTAPTGTTGSFTLTVQSTGLSLLDMNATVYASDQTTVLGSATSTVTNRTGSTLTITVSSVTAGQQMYIKVSPYDSTAFGVGAFAMTLNFGSGANPAVPLPNTETLNGNPLSTGGGQPDSPPPPDQDTPGRDIFDNPPADAAVADTASQRAAPRQAVPDFAAALAAVQAGFRQMTTSYVSGPVTLIAPIVLAGATSPVRDAARSIPLAGLSGGDATDLANPTDDEQLEYVIPVSAVATAEPVISALTTSPSAETQVDEVLPATACDAYFASAEWSNGFSDEGFGLTNTEAQRGDVWVKGDDPWMAEVAVAAGMAVAATTLWDNPSEHRDERRSQVALN
jgi:hypothetical protein